jgi:hypothetical protein
MGGGCHVPAGNRPCLLVMLGVVLCRFVRVVGGVQAMGMRHMRMVSRLLVLARVVMLGSLAMMVRGILMVLGRDVMVVGALVRLCHIVILLVRI